MKGSSRVWIGRVNTALHNVVGRFILRLVEAFILRRRLTYRPAPAVRAEPAAQTNAAPRGFTIVESLIVLAVTGALFAIGVLLIANKQSSTQFMQATREAQSQMQQYMNEVAAGYYHNNDTLRCQESSPPVKPSLTSAPGTKRGTNEKCIFMGKALQLGVQDGSADYDTYNVYTIVGLRGTAASPTSDLATARARVVARSTSDPASVPNDMFASVKLLNGLKVLTVTYDEGSGPQPIGAFGFVSSISSLGATDTSQQVNLIAIPNTALNDTQEAGTLDINDNLAIAKVNPRGGVRICLSDGLSNRSALLAVGAGGRASSVELSVKATGDCS